jgi:hypothetical protein
VARSTTPHREIPDSSSCISLNAYTSLITVCNRLGLRDDEIVAQHQTEQEHDLYRNKTGGVFKLGFRRRT